MQRKSWLRRIPEFYTQQSIRISPNTPVPVTDRVLELIDTKTFQRLRGIRQLSLAERVFPSATHSRFSHALGVYWNVLDYLRHLDMYPEFSEKFEKEDYLAILLAGLLHDLGHYPFSHQLDHLPQFPKHERLTIGLIRGEIKLFGEDISKLIKDSFGLEPERVARLLDPQHSCIGKEALLRQIIDSPLDADKCDYLPRDSYFCGLDFGSAFDRSRLISNLVPEKASGVLAIHEKGLVSAERLQLSRYWMYRSVYWGHTVRSFISMLTRACASLEALPQETQWWNHLLSFTDNDFLNWLNEACDPTGKELIAMIRFNRKPFKRFFTVSSHHSPQIYSALQEESNQKKVLTGLHEWAREQNVEIPDHHLIWDVPPTYKNKAWETFPVVLSEDTLISIEDESPVVKALGPAFLSGVRKIRLFCHPETLGRLSLANLPSLENLVQI